jgi:hypothetical protein
MLERRPATGSPDIPAATICRSATFALGNGKISFPLLSLISKQNSFCWYAFFVGVGDRLLLYDGRGTSNHSKKNDP